MLISYFGAEKGGDLKIINIDYPDIPEPLTPHTHHYFNQVLGQIKKDKNWYEAMFNPIPEHLEKKWSLEDENIDSL